MYAFIVIGGRLWIFLLFIVHSSHTNLMEIHFLPYFSIYFQFFSIFPFHTRNILYGFEKSLPESWWILWGNQGMSINRLNVHAFFTSFLKAPSHLVFKCVYSITLISNSCSTSFRGILKFYVCFKNDVCISWRIYIRPK